MSIKENPIGPSGRYLSVFVSGGDFRDILNRRSEMPILGLDYSNDIAVFLV